MYKTTRFKDLVGREKSVRFKLSYVDDIEQTYSDYDEATQEYVKTEQYLKDKERWGWNNPNLHFKCYPSPEYRPWFHTHWAYFSEVNEMGEVQADDANDAPYSCNCGSPYDTIYRGKGEPEDKITVLKVPFAVPMIGWKLDIKFPNSWPILNEPWCMDDINLGCMPWIWARTRGQLVDKGISIYAGEHPESFKRKLRDIWQLWSEVVDLKVVGDHPWTVPGKYNTGEWWEIECDGSHSYFTLDGEERVPKILETYQFDDYHDRWDVSWEEDREIPKTPTPSKDYPVEELLDKIKNYYYRIIDLV